MDEHIAVVTGATGTLGSRLVELLARKGFRVVAVSRSGAGPDAGEQVAVAADLGTPGAVDRIRTALPDGYLSMAVHAVGLPGSPGVLQVEPGMLGTAVDLKAGGFLRLIAALDDRITAGSRLVAVGGHLGSEPSEHAPLAGVANAALANLVRQLVGPVGRRGATVHLVAPGPFESPRVDALIAATASGRGLPVDAVRTEMAAEYPTGRMPTADDVAGVVMALLEPSAPALHGATLSCDGGIRRGIS